MSKKTYVLTFAQSVSHEPVNPERTTKRQVFPSFDIEFKVWPTVAAANKALDAAYADPSNLRWMRHQPRK